MKRTTYMKATVITTEGEDELLVGLCDRVAAESKFGYALEKVPDDAPNGAERWLAYAAYMAAKRQLKVTTPFEKWVTTYVGMEFDDGEDSPGTPPA